MTIIPIEKAVYSASQLGSGMWLAGAKKPVAIIIITSGGVQALDMTAAELSLADIHEMAPSLTDQLNKRLPRISDNGAKWPA
ncbi:MAG: hypothetical protein OEZ04_07450 [Nitrospinota bacterium]|nr:hypothetical protein [Nitrospinota bacterium]